ncbi:MAG: hypothetical protein ABIH37_05050 [archaeon]
MALKISTLEHLKDIGFIIRDNIRQIRERKRYTISLTLGGLFEVMEYDFRVTRAKHPRLNHLLASSKKRGDYRSIAINELPRYDPNGKLVELFHARPGPDGYNVKILPPVAT